MVSDRSVLRVIINSLFARLCFSLSSSDYVQAFVCLSDLRLHAALYSNASVSQPVEHMTTRALVEYLGTAGERLCIPTVGSWKIN